MATWTTRDGTVLQISEMTSDHLKNAAAMLERDKDKLFAEWVKETTDTPSYWMSAGEAAGCWVKQDALSICPNADTFLQNYTLYPALREEIERRKDAIKERV